MGAVLSMPIIRQPSLFSIQELYAMEPTQKYESIILALDMDAVYHQVAKKSRFGAPKELNYGAMIISFLVRYMEHISTIKELVKRLKVDVAFKMNCGFFVSEPVPSEASDSRLVMKLEESNILEKQQEKSDFSGHRRRLHN